MKWLKNHILNTPAYRMAISRLEKKRLKDYDVSFFTVLSIFFRKIKQDDIEQRANGVAFNFTLSVFPALIFFFSLIPYIPIQDLDGNILMFMAQVLPQGIWEEALPTIHDIVSRPRGRLLSFGFIFTIFASSNGMTVLMNAFNRCYKTRESRGLFRKRFTAIALTVMLGSVLVVAIVLLIVGQYAVDYLLVQGFLNDIVSVYFIALLRYGVVFLVFFLAISTIYYVAPAVHTRWKFVSLGSIVAACLCIIATHLFSYFLTNFSSYNRLYGSIGTFIGLMVWFYLLSIVLLLGFEINASIDEAKTKALKIKPV
jgi:membrane protein